VVNFASVAYTRNYFAQIYSLVTTRQITLNSLFQRWTKRDRFHIVMAYLDFELIIDGSSTGSADFSLGLTAVRVVLKQTSKQVNYQELARVSGQFSEMIKQIYLSSLLRSLYSRSLLLVRSLGYSA
jgi:hypothetical protein